MTRNKATIEEYMEAFRQGDHSRVLACLTEDVEWIIPGAFHVHGKTAFDEKIESDQFQGRPEITVERMIEENDVVVAEGEVRAQQIDGEVVDPGDV